MCSVDIDRLIHTKKCQSVVFQYQFFFNTMIFQKNEACYAFLVLFLWWCRSWSHMICSVYSSETSECCRIIAKSGWQKRAMAHFNASDHRQISNTHNCCGCFSQKWNRSRANWINLANRIGQLWCPALLFFLALSLSLIFFRTPGIKSYSTIFIRLSIKKKIFFFYEKGEKAETGFT